jgi:hypothetical protein
VAVTAALVGAGVALHSPASPPPPVSLGAPLATVDTTAIAIARAPFCDSVPEADLTTALTDALGAAGPTASTTAASTTAAPATVTAAVTAPGRPSPVPRQTADEDGCTWTSGATSAAAWIFAPPVTVAWARELVGVPHGCTQLAGLAYGSPSTAYTCAGTTTLAGLFGDAWLTCTLTSTDVAAVGRWCVAVARSAAHG